jgi:hypothetical protein
VPAPISMHRRRRLGSLSQNELQAMHHAAAAFWGVNPDENEQMRVHEADKDTQALLFKKTAGVELYVAEKRVNIRRNLKGPIRQATYLHKPDEGAGRSALGVVDEVIERARRIAEWEEESIRAREEAALQHNKYEYDLKNFTGLKEGEQVSEAHLLVLCAEARDDQENVKDLVNSNKRHVDFRTDLARQGLKINKELQHIAAERGLIPPPKEPTFYEREFKPLWDPQYSESDGSEEEEPKTKTEKRLRRVREKQKTLVLKDAKEKKRQEDAVAKEKLDLAIYKRLKGMI